MLVWIRRVWACIGTAEPMWSSEDNCVELFLSSQLHMGSGIQTHSIIRFAQNLDSFPIAMIKYSNQSFLKGKVFLWHRIVGCSPSLWGSQSNRNLRQLLTSCPQSSAGSHALKPSCFPQPTFSTFKYFKIPCPGADSTQRGHILLPQLI